MYYTDNNMEQEREKLFNEVWEEPLTTVAKRYGVSDNGLRKRCIKLQIPLPPNGYWAKLKAGKTVPEKPSLLPLVNDRILGKYRNLEQLLNIETLDKINESFNDNKDIDMSQFLKPDVREKLDNWIKSICVKKSNYNKNNPLIIEYQNEMKYRKARDDEHQFRDIFRYSYSISIISSRNKIEYRENKPVLDICVSQHHIERALAIVAVLIELVEELGGRVYVQQENKDNTIIKLYDHSFSFKLREIMQKRRSLLSTDQNNYSAFRPLYEKIPSGIFEIEISDIDNYWNKSTTMNSCKFEDTNNHLLENQFSSILNFLMKEAIRLEIQKIEIEKLNEEKMIEERNIREMEKRRINRKKVFDNIETQMEKWNKSKELLLFADELEGVILDFSDDLSRKLISDYASLVRKKAESINPIEDIINEVKGILDENE
ncbi:hypothetical protein KQI42_17485 [Tissierella sp. MSJ-40]|uniref:Uncharacterized protein n=1 Tax=Tissierella simiarum TaxID=2841534 RepID=A0ABS6EAJ7_9FIRM|nr:hypothetical protein [Tissierella simiarum]MBU5439812.1 hypothetical protein [Tissierella simiarum]